MKSQTQIVAKELREAFDRTRADPALIEHIKNPAPWPPQIQHTYTLELVCKSMADLATVLLRHAHFIVRAIEEDAAIEKEVVVLRNLLAEFTDKGDEKNAQQT